MDGWLKALIAAACVAVIGSAGWFAFGSSRDPEPWIDTSKAVEDLEAYRQRKDCERYVKQWDSGQKNAVRREFGDHSQSIVDTCRFAWTLPKE